MISVRDGIERASHGDLAWAEPYVPLYSLLRDYYGNKRRFYIFDYLSNFEFFREHQQGIEAKETQSLSEAIFAKRICLIHHFQESAFSESAYQTWRDSLIDIVLLQIQALNPELITVKLQLRAVEHFKKQEAFLCLSEQDKHDLIAGLAPLVYMNDEDEYAKRFDNFMYGLILAQMEAMPSYKKYKGELCGLVTELEKRSTIPQIKAELELIHTIGTDEFWASGDLTAFETVRQELRNLIKFIVDDGNKKQPVYTNLIDTVLSVKEGQDMFPAYDFSDYKLKVNRYIEEHRDSIAIFKLRNNIRLIKADYQSLSDILTKEIGNEDDYKREYQNLPFGLLVRKVAKLDYDAAMKAFSEFINDQSLNQQQIVFVKKVIDYVVQNGYIEDAKVLMDPPFDQPQSFIKLFDGTRQRKMVQVIEQIKENAVEIG